MADTKVTALTELTTAISSDIMYIVDDPGGTPISKKITVGNLFTFEFGNLYTAAGIGTQSLSSGVPTKIDQLDTNGLSGGSVTNDATNNKITVTNTGLYYIAFQISYTGTNNTTYTVQCYWNAAPQTRVQFQRKLGTGADVGSGSAVGVIDVTSGSTDIELYVTADGAADFDVKQLQLVALRLGQT